MQRLGVTLAASLLASAMFVGAARSVPAQQNPFGILPVGGMPDPLLLLLHDPVVHTELKLTASQRVGLGRLCDTLDVDLWKTRNQQPRQADEIRQRLKGLAHRELDEVLTPEQAKRLSQIERRTIGVRVLLRDDMVKAIGLSPEEQESIRDILKKSETSVAALFKEAKTKEAQAEKPSAELEDKARQLYIQSQKDAWQILSVEQKERAQGALGPPFDASKLGRIKFRAPEFQPATAWINSEPLTLKDLKGDVVVVFVWTHGCINCIRNYPSYLGWQRDFGDRGVKVIGVHTPEVEGERDLAMVRKKVKENGFAFPVVVDNDRTNWNAWGNSMWPSTYLIDRQGYVRAWWLGELNWEGQFGEKLLRARIEELLAE